MACAIGAGAAPTPPQDEGRAVMAEPIALASLYLDEPLGRVRQVRIRGDAGGEARLDLDQNECRVGAFGEITFRTQMDYPSLRVRLRPAGEADLPRRGRFRAFEVVPLGVMVSPDAPAGAADADQAREKLKLMALEGKSFRLALGPPPCGPARLVVLGAGGVVERVIALESHD